jgi:hypothetical protein
MAGEYDNDYSVLDIDLSLFAGKTRAEIVQNGRPIAAVTIVELPAAAVGHVRLHFGETADGIKLRQEALTIGRSPARSSGLFITVDPGITGNLELMIGIDLNVNA